MLQQRITLSAQVGRVVVATRLSDIRFVCTGEFVWKYLSLQQNFVATTSRTNSV